jgi:sarcosine oxidase subunit beta
VLGVVLLGASRKLSMKQARSGAVLIGGGKRGWGDLVTRARGPAEENLRLGAIDATAVLPVLAGIEMTRSWVGLEGLTPDEMPIIDCLDAGRLYVAAGFCGHGFAIGPVVGRLLSEWLLDGRPSLDVSMFRRDRFPAAA